MKSEKSKIVALVLCICGGFLGLHRFYVGKMKSGILYLVTLGLFGIGWIYDVFEIIANRFKDSKGAYITTGTVSPKPAYMKWSFWAAIVIFGIIAFNPSKNQQESSVSTNTDSSSDSLSLTVTETKDEMIESDSNSETSAIVNSYTETNSDINTDEPIGYEVLQNIFLELDNDYSIDNLKKSIKENNLPYTSTEYTPRDNDNNTLYVVALDEKAAQISHSFNSDSLRIDFDTESGLIRYGEYYNHKTSGTSIYYDHGGYNEFSFQESPNPYTGYYYNKELISLPKTKVVYSNGKSAIAKYSRCESAEDALTGVTIGKDFAPVKDQKENESTQKSEVTIIDETNDNKGSDEDISSLESSSSVVSKYEAPQQQITYHFILNTNTMKYHYPTCNDAAKILQENYSTYDVTCNSLKEAMDYMQSIGYSPCGHCIR